MISIIKDSSAVELYGEKAKNGVILITLKDSKKKSEIVKITNQLELRKFIAQKVKYPPKAHNAGLEGKVQLFVKIDENGGIINDDDLGNMEALDIPVNLNL